MGVIGVANLVALVMVNVLGKGMSWFSSKMSTLGLYGPAALTDKSVLHFYFAHH